MAKRRADDVGESPDQRRPNPLFRGPSSRPMQSQGYHPMPGPGRTWSRRHWARQDATGCLVLLLAAAGSVWFVGSQMGLW